MTDHAATLAMLSQPDAPLVVTVKATPATPIAYTTIILMGGSTDYLNDQTGDRRFWPTTAVREDDLPDDGQICDGLHDESAPAHFLCSRCFPKGFVELQDDMCDEPGRDEQED